MLKKFFIRAFFSCVLFSSIYGAQAHSIDLVKIINNNRAAANRYVSKQNKDTKKQSPRKQQQLLQVKELKKEVQQSGVITRLISNMKNRINKKLILGIIGITSLVLTLRWWDTFFAYNAIIQPLENNNDVSKIVASSTETPIKENSEITPEANDINSGPLDDQGASLEENQEEENQEEENQEEENQEEDCSNVNSQAINDWQLTNTQKIVAGSIGVVSVLAGVLAYAVYEVSNMFSNVR